MPALKRYRRREMTTVTAVQIALETDGFTYRKWGEEQVARAGDWLVNNNGNVYTVDGKEFGRSYIHVRDGVYEKTAPVWAETALSDGKVRSTSGFTSFRMGDFIVYSDETKADGWAMSAKEFTRLYCLDV